MSTTIRAQDGSGASTAPFMVLGYETARESRNLVHDTLDGGIAVALYVPRPRSGTLRLFYLTEADAAAAATLHARNTSFTLESTDRTTINMAYVTVGTTRTALDDATRNRWTVDVGYQEVLP